MNDESDQVDGSAHEQQTSALCERLFRRYSEPIGIINVREAERLYERIIGWVAGRYALLEQLMSRYRMDDLSGDGQPFVLEQSFWEMINASSTPAPGGVLPSQTVSLPPLSRSISPAAPTSTLIKTSVAPPMDSSNEPSPSASTKFRVSRRPLPVSTMDQADDWQSGGDTILKAAEAAHKPAASQSQTETRELRADTSSLPLQPSSLHQQMDAGHETEVTNLPLADAARPMSVNQPPTRQPMEAPQADAAASPPAKQTAVAREIASRLADVISPPEPPQLELAQSSPPQARPPAGASRDASERIADAAHEAEGSGPSSVDAVRPVRVDQATTEPPVESPAAEATQSAEEARSVKETPSAKQPAVAREIISKSAEVIPSPDPLLLKDDSATQQMNEPQSIPAIQSDRAMENHSPTVAAEIPLAPPDAVKPDNEEPLQFRTPVSLQASSALQRTVEINRSTRQAESGEPIDMALPSSPAQTAQSDAASAPSRLQESSSNAAQSVPPMAIEMRREPVHSQPVDFIWREGDDAAAEIALRQSGGSAPPIAYGFDSSIATPFSSPPAQRATQPLTQEQSNQVNLEKIPDHVINSISQQVIRALSRILIVERERKGIR
jgi:hypothetical protein